MSAIRTFTVTVQNVGGSNKYFIDGVQQDTINLAEGYTYKFDQSDNSNSTHPLRLSTTSDGTHSGGSEYTTGVTTNGTPGQAGAYTQITVAASAPTLYYYCTAHPGMGGQANTVASDTWGVLQWNQNSWGSQDTVEVPLTGQSLTSSVGLLTAFPEQGWGSDTWGTENWGESAVDVILPALSVTATVNLLSENIQVKPGWGALNWGENGWGTVESAVFNLTGLSATSSVGSITIPDQVMGLTGLSAQTAVGSLAVVVDNTLTLTSLSATSAVGSISPADVMGLTGLSATSAVGSISPADVMGLTGLSAETTLGSVIITSNPDLLSLKNDNKTIQQLIEQINLYEKTEIDNKETISKLGLQYQESVSSFNGFTDKLFGVFNYIADDSDNYTIAREHFIDFIKLKADQYENVKMEIVDIEDSEPSSLNTNEEIDFHSISDTESNNKYDYEEPADTIEIISEDEDDEYEKINDIESELPEGLGNSTIKDDPETLRKLKETNKDTPPTPTKSTTPDADQFFNIEDREAENEERPSYRSFAIPTDMQQSTSFSDEFFDIDGPPVYRSLSFMPATPVPTMDAGLISGCADAQLDTSSKK